MGIGFGEIALFKSLSQKGGIWVWVAVGVIVLLWLGKHCASLLKEKIITERKMRELDIASKEALQKSLLEEIKAQRVGIENTQDEIKGKLDRHDEGEKKFQAKTIEALNCVITACDNGFGRCHKDDEVQHQTLTELKESMAYIQGNIKGLAEGHAQ